jgi:hypothetical protein
MAILKIISQQYIQQTGKLYKKWLKYILTNNENNNCKLFTSKNEGSLSEKCFKDVIYSEKFFMIHLVW